MRILILFVVFYLPFLANGIVFFQKDTIINSNHSFTKVDSIFKLDSINIQKEDTAIKKNSYKLSKEEKKAKDIKQQFNNFTGLQSRCSKFY